MPEVVFSEPHTQDGSPKRADEVSASYLKRSTAAPAMKMRAWLNESLDLVPPKERPDIMSRLRGKDVAHRSAVWELGCVRVLHALGHTLEWHPTAPDSPKRPDWLVTPVSGDPFYFEASVVEETTNPHENRIYDALNEVESPDFSFYPVRIPRQGRSSPATSNLRKTLSQHMAALEWDADPTVEHPLCEWEHRGWEIHIGFQAKPQSRRNANERPLASLVPQPAASTMVRQLRRKLQDKGAKYGNLGRPFVIGLRIVGVSDSRAVTQALFGTEEYLPRMGSWRRRDDGVLRAPQGLPRMSAAVIATTFNVFAAERSQVDIWENPQAKHPLDLTHLPFTKQEWDAGNNKLVSVPGSADWDGLMRGPI